MSVVHVVRCDGCGNFLTENGELFFSISRDTADEVAKAQSWTSLPKALYDPAHVCTACQTTDRGKHLTAALPSEPESPAP